MSHAGRYLFVGVHRAEIKLVGERYTLHHKPNISILFAIVLTAFILIAESIVGSKLLKINRLSGGEGGIRTPGTLSGTAVFKTACFNRSHTSPRECCQQFTSSRESSLGEVIRFVHLRS